MEKPITLTIDIDAGLRKELIKMASYKGITLSNYVIDVSPEEAARVLKEFIEDSDKP